MARLAWIVLILSSTALAQSVQSNFIVDKSKPFAYLAFDHVGQGKPWYEGEGPDRIYLRIVNNCRIPILFSAHSAPEGEPGSILDDEVIPETPMLQIVSTSAEVQEIEQEERDRTNALKHKPVGYSSEVSGVLRLQPGQEALFSVPRDHVGHFWFLRVKFALNVDRSSVAVGPFTYLDFHEYQIPKQK